MLSSKNAFIQYSNPFDFDIIGPEIYLKFLPQGGPQLHTYY